MKNIILLISLLFVSVHAQDYAKPEILVDTAWITENLGADNVVLLHLAGEVADYEAAHLPGARFVTLAELNNPDDPITGQIGTAEQVAATLSKLGIDNDDTIVLYDASNNLLAARGYWVLKYYQHQDVRIYNGGTKSWEADGQSFESGPVAEVAASSYAVTGADPDIRTTSEYVVEHLDDAGVQLCDARGANEYLGTDVRSDRGGHIPGAINLDWVNAVDPQSGQFKSYEELDKLFSLAGFQRDKQIITYCQTGVRGAHTWFVLRELLGYADVRNYDGSWEEYGNNPAFPIEN